MTWAFYQKARRDGLLLRAPSRRRRRHATAIGPEHQGSDDIARYIPIMVGGFAYSCRIMGELGWPRRLEDVAS